METRCRVAAIALGLSGALIGPALSAEEPGAGSSQSAPSAHRLPAVSTAAMAANLTRERPLPSIRDLVDVTAVSASFVAVDPSGRVVRDLRAEELTVLEDGMPVRVLALDRHATASEAGEPGGIHDFEGSGPPAGQRVVLYLSADLGDSGLFGALGRQMEGETDRLTGLGPVDVVVADPEPTVITAAERRPQAVREALLLAASKASGGASVTKIRRDFARDFNPGVGFDRGMRGAAPNRGGVVVRTRDAMDRERLLVRRSLEKMVMWLQNQPPESGGVLVWMTGGFDLNPADYYLPLVEQIDPYVARTLRSDRDAYRLDQELRWVIETALSTGWTVVPVTCCGVRFVFGADIGGRRDLDVMAEQGAVSLASLGGGFAQAHPHRALQMVADATGGHLAADPGSLKHAVEHLEAAYVVNFQVERQLDGRLHELEIRCSRAGVKICCGRHRTASGTLRGVAMGRALRLLAGESLAGAREVSVTVANVTRQGDGKRVGDLFLTTDLGELKSALGPLGLGEMRVTVVVKMASGAPYVFHEEIDLDWRQVDDVWRYSARLIWPKQARNLAVVAEELVSSSWGASTLALR